MFASRTSYLSLLWGFVNDLLVPNLFVCAVASHSSPFHDFSFYRELMQLWQTVYGDVTVSSKHK